MYIIRRKSDGMYWAGVSTTWNDFGEEVELETWSERATDAVSLNDMELQWREFDTAPGVTLIHANEGV